MASVLDFESSPSLSVESQLNMLALESNVLVNVIDTFRNVIPNLAHELVERLSSLTPIQDEEIDQLKQLKKRFIEVSKKVEYANFLSYNKTLVSVPEGFKGNLLEFVHFLNKIAPEVFVEANKILGEYNFALSAFITNKENKISLKDHTDLFHRVQRRRDELTKGLNKFFSANTSLSKAPLGSVLNRFADIEDLIDDSVKLETQLNKHNLQEVQEGVKKATELLSIIIKDIESKGIQNIGGNAAMNISTGAYEIGKFVEFIAIFRYRTEQTITSVTKLVDQLDELL